MLETQMSFAATSLDGPGSTRALICDLHTLPLPSFLSLSLQPPLLFPPSSLSPSLSCYQNSHVIHHP